MGPKVHGVVEIKPVIVQLTEAKQGETQTRIGFLIGDELRFVDTKAISPPAQSWVYKGVIEHLNKKDKI